MSRARVTSGAMGSPGPSSAAAAATAAGGIVNLTETLQETFLDKDSVPRVKKCIQIMNGTESKEEGKAPFDTKQFRKLLTMAINAVESGSISEQHKDALNEDPSVAAVFLGLYELIFCATKGRVVDKVFTEDVKKMTWAPDLAKDIIAAFLNKRPDLEAGARKLRQTLPGLKKLDWRVDVTISTTQLQRVFKPTVIFQITTTDGVIKTFESGLDKFHQLRYHVSRMLATMQNIEQHPTLARLVD